MKKTKTETRSSRKRQFFEALGVLAEHQATEALDRCLEEARAIQGELLLKEALGDDWTWEGEP